VHGTALYEESSPDLLPPNCWPGSCLKPNFFARFAAFSSRTLRFRSFDLGLEQEPLAAKAAKCAKKFKLRRDADLTGLAVPVYNCVFGKS